MTKRMFDVLMGGASLLILAPLFVIVALAVKVGDWGPVFYRQERVGMGGRSFLIWKFRSMRVNAERFGSSFTCAGDPRVTRVGAVLRKTKLDELPQLFNVLTGEMSLVGPRPEVPKYVALYTTEQRRVLELKPGITDLASIEFRHEEEMLAAVPAPESFYLTYCIPRKIALNLKYAENASLWSDIGVILRTLVCIIR